MKTFIKWLAVIVLAPLFVIIEIRNILRESDIDIPNPDEVLNDMKREMNRKPKKKKKTGKDRK